MLQKSFRHIMSHRQSVTVLSSVVLLTGLSLSFPASVSAQQLNWGQICSADVDRIFSEDERFLALSFRFFGNEWAGFSELSDREKIKIGRCLCTGSNLENAVNIALVMTGNTGWTGALRNRFAAGALVGLAGQIYPNCSHILSN